jgi:hypothetical protein
LAEDHPDSAHREDHAGHDDACQPDPPERAADKAQHDKDHEHRSDPQKQRSLSPRGHPEVASQPWCK